MIATRNIARPHTTEIEDRSQFKCWRESKIFFYALICCTLFVAGDLQAAELGDNHGHNLPSREDIAKLPADGGDDFNRLVFEQSPYLRQHAANPVDWYPWGEEAFEQARVQDKPVFLSIGYSTCHWCHVMERESFADEEVAALLNEFFICIKVDREERPDIDEVYMAVTQAMTGAGGWPMTVLLTPEKKPFYAATYIPKRTRGGRPGMMDLIPSVGGAWKTQKDDILKSSEDIANQIALRIGQKANEKNLDAGTLDLAFSQLSGRFDEKNGGFGQGNKFPSAHQLTFLLRYWKRTGDARALSMVEKTLTAMRYGGIYDQVGWGVHRYSTDPEWLVPHFEKMLYDQAIAARAYLEAYQATGNDLYAETAREIFAYVARDMTSEEGAFYSAEDADSEGEEGKFYLWTVEEVEEVLGEEDAVVWFSVFSFEREGNFFDRVAGEKPGTNIAHMTNSIEDVAPELSTDSESLRPRLEAMRQKLFDRREKRVHPFKDDKVLTDWNGLMIGALALGAQALDEPEYAKAATRAADFILTDMRDEAGRLRHRFRQGEAGLPAHLEDYAYFVQGLLDLYEATFEIRYLRAAIELTDIMVADFRQPGEGGFYKAAAGGESFFIRPRAVYDGARPSGNAIAALDLFRLARMTGNTDYEAAANDILKFFSGTVAPGPSQHTAMLHALDFATGPAFEVVIAGERGSKDTRTMLAALRAGYLPNKVVVLRTSAEDDGLPELAPFTLHQKAIDGRATAYVCRNFACKAPTTTIEQMLEALTVSSTTDRLQLGPLAID